MRPTRHPSAGPASARFAEAVDLPTPPLPLATATICFTPAILRGCATPAAALGAVGAGCSIWTLTAGTPPTAATERFTLATTFVTCYRFTDPHLICTFAPAYG